MLWPDEKRKIERLTKAAKRAAIALVSKTGLPSEDKEAVGHAVAEAFERELTRVVSSYGTGPRR